jgi:hypothetical protein
MDWIAVLILVVGVVLIGGIVYLAVRGWVKYPEERGRGGSAFNSSVPGAPPIVFDRDKPPEAPRMVVPGEKSS